MQAKIDMDEWNLQAEKQAIQKKIEQAKKIAEEKRKSQMPKPKPFRGQKRSQVPAKRKAEKEQKPKKKLKQKKISHFLKKA